MNKQTTNNLVPKLRFPEFRDAGEWEEKDFGELCKFTRGPFGGTLKKEIFVKDGYAVYEQSHAIYENFDSFRYYITEEKFNELKRFSVLPDDIIMSCSGTMGKFAIVPKESRKGVINQALLKLTVKKGNDFRFIKGTLELPINQEKLLSQSAGGAIKNVVSVDQIKEIGLHIPGLQEQQKIASCLSSIDELITAQTQKLDALKTHKRGLMQQLFPVEGETVPKLRFPEFKDNEAWDIRKFGDLVELKGRIGYRGYTIEDIVKKGEGAISLSPSNIDENGSLIFEKSTYISWRKYEESPEIMLEEGFTVLVKTASCGKTALVKKIPEKATINPQLVVLKPIQIDAVFLSYLVSNSSIQKQIKDNVGKGAIPNLSQESISKFQVFIPRKNEQQKIADCISSIDELITAQNQKLDAFKVHKKGLMQQLFPTLNKSDR